MYGAEDWFVSTFHILECDHQPSSNRTAMYTLPLLLSPLILLIMQSTESSSVGLVTLILFYFPLVGCDRSHQEWVSISALACVIACSRKFIISFALRMSEWHSNSLHNLLRLSFNKLKRSKMFSNSHLSQYPFHNSGTRNRQHQPQHSLYKSRQTSADDETVPRRGNGWKIQLRWGQLIISN